MALKPSAETIVEMLQAAYDLESFDLPLGACGDAELQSAFEGAVGILADRAADRIQRGLYRRYVTTVADLIFDHEPGTARRGLTALFGQDTYLRCSYRSELPGLEDNLILMWTLHAASRMHLRSPVLRRKVEHGWRTLAGALAMTEANAETGIRRFYDRLALDERPLHGLCRFVLEHTGQQSKSSAAFRLSLPALFAAYIAKWAQAALRPAGTVRVDYGIRVEPGFRVVVEPVAVTTGSGADRRRMIVCPVYDGISLTDAALGRIAVRAGAWKASLAMLVFGVAPRQLPAGRKGVVLRSALFDPGAGLPAAREAFLRDVGCARSGTPLHRPVGRHAKDGTRT